MLQGYCRRTGGGRDGSGGQSQRGLQVIFLTIWPPNKTCSLLFYDMMHELQCIFSGKLLTWSMLTVQEAWIGKKSVYHLLCCFVYILFFLPPPFLAPSGALHTSLLQHHDSCSKLQQHDRHNSEQLSHGVLVVLKRSSKFNLTGRSWWPGWIFVGPRSMFQKSQVHLFFYTSKYWILSNIKPMLTFGTLSHRSVVPFVLLKFSMHGKYENL